MKRLQPNKSPRERRKALLEEKRASSCTSGLRCSVPDPYGDGYCRRMKGHDGYHTHGGLAWAPNIQISNKQ